MVRTWEGGGAPIPPSEGSRLKRHQSTPSVQRVGVGVEVEGGVSDSDFRFIVIVTETMKLCLTHHHCIVLLNVVGK